MSADPQAESPPPDTLPAVVQHPSQSVRQALETARADRAHRDAQRAALQTRADDGEDVAADLVVARERVTIADARIARLTPEAEAEQLAEHRASWQRQRDVLDTEQATAEQDAHRAALAVTEAVRDLVATVQRRNATAAAIAQLGSAPGEFLGTLPAPIGPGAMTVDLDAIVGVAVLDALPGDGPSAHSAFRTELHAMRVRHPLAGQLPARSADPFATPLSTH